MPFMDRTAAEDGDDHCVEPGSPVSMMSDYELHDRDSIPDRSRDRLWGPPNAPTPPPPPPDIEHRGPFHGSKTRLGGDADHSPNSNAEIKKD